MSSLLSSLLEYQLRYHSSNPLHPLHKTEIDEELKKLQRLSKSAKGAETKLNVRLLFLCSRNTLCALRFSFCFLAACGELTQVAYADPHNRQISS